MARLKIGIVGLGMVGDPIRRWFEEMRGYVRGENLFCYDINPRLRYFDDVRRADAIFIALPSPPRDDGSCDTSWIEEAIYKIDEPRTIVIKSTVIPGTTEEFQLRWPDYHILHCPEFLTEAIAWINFVSPPRQLVGHTEKSFGDALTIRELLPKAPFMRPWAPVYGKIRYITATEAEMIKYSCNVFGALKVSYGNALNLFTRSAEYTLEQGGIVTELRYKDEDDEGIYASLSADPRIGDAWLDVDHGNFNGYGGYCFPKDTNAFVNFGRSLVDKLSNDPNVRKPYLRAMRAAVKFTAAIQEFNSELLGAQELSEELVSKHNHELEFKVKPLAITD